jgi:putative membrane protein
MMSSWGGWYGPFNMIGWLLLLALVVAAVAWFVRPAGGPADRAPRNHRPSAGLDVLEERYARGEIDREEYLQKKRDILG